MELSGNWNYPSELPVVECRQQILDALQNHPLIVVVSDTGSGKTTQLPKMVAEALGSTSGRIGCTQPRRLAAVSVATRVASELGVRLGEAVGYKVRFEEMLCPQTRIKFMTDGILLAEIQSDPNLYQYSAIIIDEAHERSLNIDFLMGWLQRLLAVRKDLKVVISSATLDAGSFASFFSNNGIPAPVIEALGRIFPVSEEFLPAMDDEDIAQHVVRAVDHLDNLDPDGDVLVFLPGEREIRDCAEVLDGHRYRNTEILPLFARLGLGDQQRVFNPGNMRRIILATNVAETSLTIPRIACVIDSGVARVSRWSPGRGVQRLQIEPVSQASARQRKGRCGRVREGICIRMFEQEDLDDRPEFTDPEIRRSSLAGVILRMKALGLPEIDEFPFLDPPSSKAISEGYRTLREVGAIDRDRQLTDFGRMMSRLPVDPRLGRMLIEARIEHCLAEMVTVVAALESSDPRERPADKSHEADAAHARWKDNESDFIGILRLWRDVEKFRDKNGKWRRNALRKYCGGSYLNHRRVIEWGNVADELQSMLEREWNCKLGELAAGDTNYPSLHRSLLAGIPRQFGLWDREKKCYRSALGGFFSIFPGSGLSDLPKRHEWVLAMDLVETNRLWARRVARIDPEWVEQVAPHLCRSQYGEAHWDEKQGAVYGKQRVICGGLAVISGRKIHYGRVDPQTAYEIFLREALLAGGLRKKCRFTNELESLRLEIQNIEHKLRRLDGLWSEEAVLQFCQSWVPKHIHTAASFHKWLSSTGSSFSISVTDILEQPLELLGLENFPDQIQHEGQEFPIYYQTAPGERDDGVTIGIHIDQLPCLPEWLPGWGVDGHLEERSEILLRSLPKNERRICQPIAAMAEGFAALWCKAPKDRPILQALTEYIRERTGTTIGIDLFDLSRLPKHLITHLWICNDEGEELAMGDDLAEIKLALSDRMRERFEALAAEGIERSGISTWDGEDLPDSVTTPGGEVYPALHDEGTRVGVRIFSKLPDAEESHRSGGARLLCIAHQNEVDYLKKKFPISTLSKIGMARLGEDGTSLDDLILLAAEGVASAIYPRSPAKFQQLVTKTRGRWYDAACQIGTSLDQILELMTPIEEWLKKHRDNRNFNEIVTDLDEQLAWLFRPRFAWRAGYQGLLGYPHRIKAIHSRLARISSMPIIKDLEKMKRLHRWWSPWFQLWLRNPDDPALWQVAWALEDFRVSLFAPDMPGIGKVSEKSIERLLAQCQEKPGLPEGVGWR